VFGVIGYLQSMSRMKIDRLIEIASWNRRFEEKDARR